MSVLPEHHYALPVQVKWWALKARRIVVQCQITDEQPRQFVITRAEALSMARSYPPDTKIRATMSGSGTLYLG